MQNGVMSRLILGRGRVIRIYCMNESRDLWLRLLTCFYFNSLVWNVRTVRLRPAWSVGSTSIMSGELLIYTCCQIGRSSDVIVLRYCITHYFIVSVLSVGSEVTFPVYRQLGSSLLTEFPELLQHFSISISFRQQYQIYT